tara:strand:+ start:215 stop:673 length:459 start_codon:yes stop_codon:yes gene_type:complete
MAIYSGIKMFKEGRKKAAKAVQKKRRKPTKADEERNKMLHPDVVMRPDGTTPEEGMARMSIDKGPQMSMERMSMPRSGTSPKPKAKAKRRQPKRKIKRVINLKQAPRVVKKESAPPRIINKRKKSIQLKLNPDDYIIDSDGRVILPKGFPVK